VKEGTIAARDFVRLMAAPDLVSRTEYGKTETGRRPVATVYQSPTLGLAARVEIPVPGRSDLKRAASSRPDVKKSGDESPDAAPAREKE